MRKTFSPWHEKVGSRQCFGPKKKGRGGGGPLNGGEGASGLVHWERDAAYSDVKTNDE